MKHSKAIVTLAIGEKYEKLWKNVCRANWQGYADKHGYDLICIDRPLDDSERARQRSPAWQKCLILSRDDIRCYERVVWIDADILINTASAPCVATGVPLDKVGAVSAWSQPTPELFAETMRRMYEFWGPAPIVSYTPKEYYANHGLPSAFPEVVQTGVLVLSPKYHRELLERTYVEYEETGGPCSNYEQPALSYEILRSDGVHWIDGRFNAIWYFERMMNYPFLLTFEQTLQSWAKRKVAAALGLSVNSLYKACVTAVFLRSFFLHFPATLSDMALVDWAATSWRDCKI